MAAVTNESIVEIVGKFLRMIKDANIRIEKAILFGSYPKGKA